MKCEFLEFTAGRFGKKEVDNARSVAFSRAGWKIPAIINLRGRVEGYVRNPPLENSSWPVSKAILSLPPPSEITRAEPAASITLNIAENESPLLWKERWPHSEKLLRRKFYKTQTHLYYTRLAVGNYISILSNDRYLWSSNSRLFEQSFSNLSCYFWKYFYISFEIPSSLRFVVTLFIFSSIPTLLHSVALTSL